jgi:hypothetical protein
MENSHFVVEGLSLNYAFHRCDQKKNLAIDVILKRYTMSERGRKGVVKMGSKVEIARC